MSSAQPWLKQNWRTKTWAVSVGATSIKADADARQITSTDWNPPDRDFLVYAANWLQTSGSVGFPGGFTVTWSSVVDLDLASNTWTDPELDGDMLPLMPDETGYRALTFTGKVVTTLTLIDSSSTVLHSETVESTFSYDAYGTPAACAANGWSTIWMPESNVAITSDIDNGLLEFTASVSAVFDAEMFSGYTTIQERCPTGRTWNVNLNAWSGTATAPTVYDETAIAFSAEISNDTGYGEQLDDTGLHATCSFSRSYSEAAPGAIDHDAQSYTFVSPAYAVSIDGNTVSLSSLAGLNESCDITFTDLYSPRTLVLNGTAKYLNGSGSPGGTFKSASGIQPRVWDAVTNGWIDDATPVEWSAGGMQSIAYPGGWQLEALGIGPTDDYYYSSGVARYDREPGVISVPEWQVPAGEDSSDKKLPMVCPTLDDLLHRDNAVSISQGTVSTPTLLPGSGWVASNCSVSYPGGGGIAISGISASATCAHDFFSSKIRLQGARYLDVTFACDTADAECTLSISEHEYTLVASSTAGATVTRRIDLCRANGTIQNTHESILQKELPGGPALDRDWILDRGWGPSRVTEVVFAPPSGTEWTVTGMSLVNIGDALAYVVPQAPPGETAYVWRYHNDANPLLAWYFIRPLLFLQDGRPLLEGCVNQARTWDMHNGAASGLCPFFPQDDYDSPSAVQTNDRITITPDVPDSGSWWAEVENTLDYLDHCWGVSADGLSLDSTLRFLWLGVPPGFGNLTYTVEKYTRSAEEGLAWVPDTDTPSTGAVITYVDANGVTRTVVVDSQGRYMTAACPVTNVTIQGHTLTVLINRHLQRYCLEEAAGSGTASTTAIVRSPGLEAVYAAINKADGIWLRVYDYDTQRNTERLVTATQTSSSLGLAVVSGRIEDLVLVYDNAGTIYRTVSNDDGKTWSTPVSLALGSYPQVAYNQADLTEIMTYYYDGKAYCRRKPGPTGNWTTAAEIASSAETVAPITPIGGRGNKWAVLITGADGSITRYTSSNGGRTWTADE